MSASPSIDLSERRRLHLVGVGGAGMSAIATILAQMGHSVSGSESADLAVLERLQREGVAINQIQDGSHITGDIDAVFVSTAIPSENAEITAAKGLQIPVLHRSEAQAAMLVGTRSIAVAGSHGKSTTTALLASALRACDVNASALLGADIAGMGNGWFRSGSRFVMEADESDGTFRRLVPTIAVITNIEPDHLEYYGNFDALVEAFQSFLDENVGEAVIVNADDPISKSLRIPKRMRCIRVGTSLESDWQITQPVLGGTGAKATLRTATESFALSIPIPGEHNLMNATMAIAAGLELGVPAERLLDAVSHFPGLDRRFARRSRPDGVIVVDDYAHLPSEVRATIAAARQGASGAVVAVFQPHRYSRTAQLAAAFSDAFSEADETIITEVYAAGETPRPGVSGQSVVDAVVGADPKARVSFRADRDAVRSRLREIVRPGDTVLLLGAGDIGTWGADW